MQETESVKNKTYKILLDVDINAKALGFDSARTATRAHHRVMKHFSSVLLLGPPAGEDLLEFVAHIFTEGEADVAQHLPPLLPRTATQVARRCGRPVADLASVLDNLADIKHVILSFGSPSRYTILPLIPGLFEMAVISPDLARNNRWHKRFAELFEKVWESNYVMGYLGNAPAPVRYLPVRGSNPGLQTTWPAEVIEEALAPHNLFGMAHCQCRVVTTLAEKGCGKPTGNCVAMGPMAKPLIERGFMRKADRREVIEAKLLAEENGCVTWLMNGMSNREGNISCSCCGCCCHALRTITQFNAPGLFSAPHFMPRKNDGLCSHCGNCVRACPMGAWKENGGELHYEFQRCIGCGLCVKACGKGALELAPCPNARKPEKDFASLLVRTAPAFAANTFKVWFRRVAGI